MDRLFYAVIPAHRDRSDALADDVRRLGEHAATLARRVMATHARLLAALLAGATVVAAGCGETTDQGRAAAADLADAEVVATTLEVVATDHHFTVSATTVAEGMVPVELVNDGESPHHVLVVRLDDGQTMDDYLAAFEGGEGAADELVTHAGGVNAVDPGSSAVGYADLAPGSYLVLCFIPGEEGEAHLTDGMVAELEVVPVRPGAQPHDHGRRDLAGRLRLRSARRRAQRGGHLPADQRRRVRPRAVDHARRRRQGPR